MLALIMAGGKGSRLNRGEKPLLGICGHPMISYVIDSFTAAGCEPVVVTSFRTPMTRNWCRARGIMIHNAKGAGYIADMVEAVLALEENTPLFVSVSDIPCISGESIASVRDFYEKFGKTACSTWIPVPASPGNCQDHALPYRESIDGKPAYPAGVNILTGSGITEEQEEVKLLIDDPGLAINVNMPGDIARAEDYFRSGRR